MWEWLRDWFVVQGAELLAYAARNPFEFVFYVLLALSPFFAVSAALSFQLTKAIEKEQKEKKRRAKIQSNVAKTRGGKKQD